MILLFIAQKCRIYGQNILVFLLKLGQKSRNITACQLSYCYILSIQTIPSASSVHPFWLEPLGFSGSSIQDRGYRVDIEPLQV